MIGLFITLMNSRGRWRVLAIGWIATAILGMWGLAAAPGDTSFLDNLYTLPDVFTLGLSVELGSANWQLQIARWLGPLVAAASLLEGLVAVSRRQTDAFQAARRTGHSVVLGLGERGTRIAEALSDAGRTVVAVEVDTGDGGIRRLRRRGCEVVEGDAREQRTLKKAGVPAAAEVVVVCGADATNAEIVAALGALERAPGASGLRVAVHLHDAGLCSLLRHQSLRTAGRGIRFDFFDVYSAGARLLLERHPLAAAANGSPPHLVVAGIGQLGRCLVQEAARNAGDAGIAITLVDRDAAARLEGLLLAHPGLAGRADWRAVDVDLERPAREGAERLRGALGDATTVVVAFDDDARAVTTGLLLRRLLEGRPAEVIARTSGSGGLSLLLGGGADAGVIAFPLLERACTPAIVEGGAHEQVARAIHADYVERVDGTPYDVPWDELPADVQESNRRQADALAASLLEIGCDLVPLGGWGARRAELTDDEVERLARREHERWMAERTAAGWRYGPVRDAAAKVNPLLLDWAELPPEAQAEGRAAARRIPAVLSLAGLEVLRLDGAAATSGL